VPFSPWLSQISFHNSWTLDMLWNVNLPNFSSKSTTIYDMHGETWIGIETNFCWFADFNTCKFHGFIHFEIWRPLSRYEMSMNIHSQNLHSTWKATFSTTWCLSPCSIGDSVCIVMISMHLDCIWGAFFSKSIFLSWFFHMKKTRPRLESTVAHAMFVLYHVT
jgi:hypothetical protein